MACSIWATDKSFNISQFLKWSYTAKSYTTHAGGVIDFERDYYGADFRWTGKELLPNTTFSCWYGFRPIWMKTVKAIIIL